MMWSMLLTGAGLMWYCTSYAPIGTTAPEVAIPRMCIRSTGARSAGAPMTLRSPEVDWSGAMQVLRNTAGL